MKNLSEIAKYEKVKSALVYADGQVVYEYYSPRSGRDVLEPINSITKSVVSLVFGIAMDKGYIEEVEEDIERQLTMSVTGEFHYSNASAHILSKYITEKTGLPLEEFANEHLFRPLGIEFPRKVEPISHDLSKITWHSTQHWDKDRQGYNVGGVGLRLTLRDMYKIGLLILQNGQYEGRQLVSKEYLERACKPHVRAKGYYYGYQIWIRKMRGVDTISARGVANQYLTIIPEANAIVAMLCDSNGLTEEHIEKLHGDIIQYVSKQTH